MPVSIQERITTGLPVAKAQHQQQIGRIYKDNPPVVALIGRGQAQRRCLYGYFIYEKSPKGKTSRIQIALAAAAAN